jgi:hypothetical protein
VLSATARAETCNGNGNASTQSLMLLNLQPSLTKTFAADEEVSWTQVQKLAEKAIGRTNTLTNAEISAIKTILARPMVAAGGPLPTLPESLSKISMTSGVQSFMKNAEEDVKNRIKEITEASTLDRIILDKVHNEFRLAEISFNNSQDEAKRELENAMKNGRVHKQCREEEKNQFDLLEEEEEKKNQKLQRRKRRKSRVLQNNVDTV